MSNANRVTEQQQITQVYRELSPSDKVVFETVLNFAFVLLKSLQHTKDVTATFETALNLAFVLLKSLQQTKEITATKKKEG